MAGRADRIGVDAYGRWHDHHPAMQGEIQYTHGTYTKPQGVAGQTVKIPG